jgi:hypothetical protein
VFSLFAVLTLVISSVVAVNVSVQEVVADEVPFSTDAVACFDEVGQTPKVTPTYETKCGGEGHLDQEGFALEVTTTEDGETVEIPVGEYENYDWNIAWQDGSQPENMKNGQDIDGIYYSARIPHVYDTSGTHIIRITPNGLLTLGWFDAFGNGESKNITKILTPFSSLSRTSGLGMFNGTFHYLTNANNLPENLFASIDTSEMTNFDSMFDNTFENYAKNSTTATIPAKLFNSLNTSKGTDLI